MKKVVLLVLLFNVVLCVFSQTDENTSEKVKTNEIGLDMFDLALLHTLDVSIEYVKSSELGFGMTARVCFDSDSDAGTIASEKYSFTPFFRYYFFNKQDYGSKGFYAETFLKMFGGTYSSWSSYFDYSSNFFDAALGVGLGYKYVSRSGFIVDLNLGVGRSLGLSDLVGDIAVGRGSITFGYRF